MEGGGRGGRGREKEERWGERWGGGGGERNKTSNCSHDYKTDHTHHNEYIRFHEGELSEHDPGLLSAREVPHLDGVSVAG